MDNLHEWLIPSRAMFAIARAAAEATAEAAAPSGGRQAKEWTACAAILDEVENMSFPRESAAIAAALRSYEGYNIDEPLYQERFSKGRQNLANYLRYARNSEAARRCRAGEKVLISQDVAGGKRAFSIIAPETVPDLIPPDRDAGDWVETGAYRARWFKGYYLIEVVTEKGWKVVERDNFPRRENGNCAFILVPDPRAPGGEVIRWQRIVK